MWVGKFALSPEGLPAGGVAWVDLGTTAASSPAVVNGAAYHPTYQSLDGVSALYVTTEAVASSDTYIGGFRYRSDGALRVYDATSAVPAGANTNQGIALTSDGQLCYTTGNTTAFALNGVAVDTERRVYAAPLAFELQFADLGAGVVDTTEEITGATATFTRATTAWTILSNGTWGAVASGSPRSYYSPSGTYLGYLAEGARTNLVVQSQDFNTTWSAVGTPSFSANSTTLGALNLDTIGDDSAAALEGYTQVIGFTGNAVKAISIFVKKGTSTSSIVRVRDTTAGADRLLAAVTWSGTVPVVTMTTGTDLTGTPEQFASSGVYRLSFATTSVTATNTNQVEFYPATDAALEVANVGTIEAGGVQAEDATFASSYIPTTTAAVTRNADVLTYPTTGWLNASAGTMYAEARHDNDPGSFFGLVSLNNGTTSQEMYLANPLTGGQQIGFMAIEAGGTDGSMVGANGSWLLGDSGKIAGAYSENDCAMSVNGLAAIADTTVTPIPTVDRMYIGLRGNGTSVWAGPIRRVAYYNARLPNATLQLLTA